MVKLAGRRGSRRHEPTPARTCAFRVLQRTFGEGAYADRAFRAEAERAGLDARDRAFAQRLAYGAIQNRRTLDYVIMALSARDVGSLDLPVLNALRLGIYQVALLDGVPDHAAVDQSVDLAKYHGDGGHRLVNAVMRRAAREAGDLIAQLTDNSPAEAAVRHSHPEWVVRMWWDALGAAETIALLERDNGPAENAVRANELLVTPEEVAAALADQGVESRVADDIPEGLVLDGQFDAHGSQLFKEGAIMPQSRASMLVARVLEPQPGDRVLDLCAAPGAKATHIAALLGNEGEVVAVEKHRGRAKSLGENCERLGATCVTVREERFSLVRTCAGRRTRRSSEGSRPSRRASSMGRRRASGPAGRSSTQPARSRRRRTSVRSSATSTAIRTSAATSRRSCCRTATARTGSSSRGW
jgi:16S rRNA (cytosine967-C5)-methyltransferase